MTSKQKSTAHIGHLADGKDSEEPGMVVGDDPPEDSLLSKDDHPKDGIPTRHGKFCRRIVGDEAHKLDGKGTAGLPDVADIHMAQRFIVTRRGFFDVMQRLAQDGNQNKDRQRFYFRGEGCSEFLLLPTLLRDTVYGRLSDLHDANGPIDLQKRLLDRYRRYTQHLIHSDNDFKAPIWDDFDTLCLAQHHGLPTLLMDWTLNPYVAAYFAISDAYRTFVREKLAAYKGITKYWVRVWVMRLKKPADREPVTVHLEDRKRKWDEKLGDRMMTPAAPLIVVPLVFTRRIAAQAGRFVYCGYMANEFQNMSTWSKVPKTSLARYSYEHYESKKKPQTGARSKDPEELGWDQLYSLDIEFDIGTDAEEHRTWQAEEKGSDAQLAAKLDAFRVEMMKMMSDLEFIGFHAGRLFPDLEGWARYLGEGNL